MKWLAADVSLLTKVLEQLLDAHVRLVNLSEQQRQALVAGDINRLNTIVQRIDAEMERVRVLERHRQKVAARLQAEIGTGISSKTNSELETGTRSAAAPTVSALIAALPNEAQTLALRRVAGLLKQTMADLARRTELNASLTSQSLQFVTKTFELCLHLVKPVTYGRSQQAQSISTRPVGAHFISIQV